MEKIKISRRPASRNAALGDVSEPALMRFENFETLLGFKPRLDLLDAENHEAPEMSKQNGPKNIEAPTDDPKRPSAQEINRGLGGDYKNNPDTAVEDVPHENEGTKQNSTNFKPAARKRADGTENFGQGEDLTSQEYQTQVNKARGGEDTTDPEQDAGQNNGFDSEADANQIQEEYAEKFMVGAQLADIKIAASLLKEVERYQFIHKVASENSVDSLHSLLSENQTLYESMNSRVEASRQKQASISATEVSIPRITPSSYSTGNNLDSLSIVLGGLGGGGN